MNLEQYLNTKPLYYDDIDYAYFPDLWSRIKCNFNITAKIIHIILTNGKGTTNKTISYYLFNCKYHVGSYSSPELFRYDDMYTLNNLSIEENVFEFAHNFLQKIIPYEDKKKISRFEYTTLIAIKIFQSCDYMILEAGLGGEYDATNVLKKDLSVVTTIGIDHIEFLGDNIESIVLTKLNSINNKMVIGKQVYDDVYKISKELLKSKKVDLNIFTDVLLKKEIKSIDEFCNICNYPEFIINNIKLGLSAIKLLKINIDIKMLNNISFPGRFEHIKHNIIIDVGHNSLAASSIVNNINNNTILIYNSYHNKDYIDIISIFLKKIKKILLIDVEDERVCNVDYLYGKLKRLPVDISIIDDNYVLDNNNNYLVFGSFSVIKEFYRRFLQEEK